MFSHNCISRHKGDAMDPGITAHPGTARYLRQPVDKCMIKNLGITRNLSFVKNA